MSYCYLLLFPFYSWRHCGPEELSDYQVMRWVSFSQFTEEDQFKLAFPRHRNSEINVWPLQWSKLELTNGNLSKSVLQKIKSTEVKIKASVTDWMKEWNENDSITFQVISYDNNNIGNSFLTTFVFEINLNLYRVSCKLTRKSFCFPFLNFPD